MTDAFRTGEGVGWHEHDPDLFEGTERFFRPGYNANLVDAWIPALDGVEAKLKARRAGRRHRLRPWRLARSSWPRPIRSRTFVGFDYHGASIERARKRAAEAGVGGPGPLRGRDGARPIPGTYDLVASSTACTTWAIRSARRRTCASR